MDVPWQPSYDYVINEDSVSQLMSFIYYNVHVGRDITPVPKLIYVAQFQYDVLCFGTNTF
jgi:hypothetical protein